MTLPANLKLLPGIRQDHRGRFYQLGQYPSGKSVMVPYQQEKRADPMMEPVIVESLGYHAAKSLEAQNEQQAKLLAAAIARGPTYQSIRFYHTEVE